MKISPQHVTGLVLAGGRGTRMGGVDKGLQLFEGNPLALHALRRLQPQVAGVAVNANRNLPAYEAFDAPVWPDGLADYPGPLAGFLSGLSHCPTPWLLTIPCDTPRFPTDLAERMIEALVNEHHDMVVGLRVDQVEAAYRRGHRTGTPNLRPGIAGRGPHAERQEARSR